MKRAMAMMLLSAAMLAGCTFEINDYEYLPTDSRDGGDDMTFSRSNPAGWALYETLTSAQMNALDINVSKALDGDAGGDYSPSSALKVHGKIIGENVASRTILYPIALGFPFAGDAVNSPYWTFDPASDVWTADDTPVSPGFIQFPLNRIIPQNATLIGVRAYVGPADSASGSARMRISLKSYDNDGSGGVTHDISYYPNEGSNPSAWMEMITGFHDGGDGQASLTDSLKSWPVNSLVGRTIQNLTDGSSGPITANSASGVTATLSGGTDNDWDDDDRYFIPLSEVINSDTKKWVLLIRRQTAQQNDYMYSLELTYVEGDYLRLP